MTGTAVQQSRAPAHLRPRDRSALARKLRDAGITFAVWGAGALVFFRAQWESGFRTIMGNEGDTRLIVYLLEHWFTVLHGRASWTNPAFYYPVKGVLGWSDGFILFEAFYTPLRLLGADPFLAAQLTVIAVSLVGFASFVALTRLVFQSPRWVALAGALIFTFANNLWINAGNFQFFGLYFVPLVLLLGVRAARASTSARSILLGAGCGLLAGLLFFTTYYIAWFSALACGLAVFVGLVVSPRRMVAAATTLVRRSWVAIAAGAGAFIVSLVPFLDVYLPARREVQHPTYNQVVHLYGIHLAYVLNTGSGNVLWGGFLRSLVPSLKNATGEMEYGVTPLLMIAAVVFSLLAVWVSRRRSSGRASTAAYASLVLAITAVLLCLFPVRFQSGTLWAVVWRLPGGSAIRVPDRMEVVTGLVAVLALVAAVTELRPRVRGRRSIAAIAGLCCVFAVLAVEQLNTSHTSAINHDAEMAYLRSVPPPPSACKSFYVVDNRVPGPAWFVLQIDAMLISQRANLPTLNGYTGYDPPNWMMKHPGPDYLSGVLEWISLNDITGVCELDLATRTWTVGPSA